MVAVCHVEAQWTPPWTRCLRDVCAVTVSDGRTMEIDPTRRATSREQ